MQNNLKDIDDFEDIYLSYYPRLKRFAQEYVVNEADAENIVQDIFMDLWTKREFFSSQINLTAYLFTNIKNRCIDFHRHRMVVMNATRQMQEEFELTMQMKLQSLEALDEQIISDANIETIIDNAIQSLPERCRQIFIMNKIEAKKQKIIAEELNISLNTVENQMAIAYQKLREILKDYLPILFFLLI